MRVPDGHAWRDLQGDPGLVGGHVRLERDQDRQVARRHRAVPVGLRGGHQGHESSRQVVVSVARRGVRCGRNLARRRQRLRHQVWTARPHGGREGVFLRRPGEGDEPERCARVSSRGALVPRVRYQDVRSQDDRHHPNELLQPQPGGLHGHREGGPGALVGRVHGEQAGQGRGVRVDRQGHGLLHEARHASRRRQPEQHRHGSSKRRRGSGDLRPRDHDPDQA